MLSYIAKRLIAIPFTLLALSLLIFSLTTFLSPAERAAVFISNPDELQYVDMQELISRYGLDEPFHVQYLKWLKGVLSGDWGWSTTQIMPVTEALRQRIPATIELMFAGQVLIIIGTIAFGTLAAKRHKQWPDNLIRFLITLGFSLPNFVIGIFLLVIFYVWLGILSPGQLGLAATDVVHSQSYVTYTGLNLVDSILNGRLDVFWDTIRHIILPSVTFALGTMAASTRIMRSSMLENMQKGYADTARIKGLPEKRVIDSHVRRNALIPTITFIGMHVPILLGGSVIIETVFNYPGMGLLIVKAAKGLDFATIIGASLAICIIIMISNLVVDLLYGVLSPQLRQQ